jgi:magnesium chelatase subunit D
MTAPQDAPRPADWLDAALAAAVLAVDPAGIGGAVVTARPGPVRDRWIALLRGLLPEAAPVRRVPLHISDANLLGGLDLVATLSAGRPVVGRGLLAEADGGVLLLAMAERMVPGQAARLAAVLDTGEAVMERDGIALRSPARVGMVALDEAAEDDEGVPEALRDRLALHLRLEGIPVGEAGDVPFEADDVAAARSILPLVRVGDASLEALCAAAAALGIGSARAPLLAMRAAAACAALDGRTEVGEDDVAAAARLVYASRATMVPAAAAEEREGEAEEQPPDDQPPDDQPPPPPEDGAPEAEQRPDDPQAALEDVILAAAQAAMPEGLLRKLQAGRTERLRSSAQQGRAGAQQTGGPGRGRPAGTRRGAPDRGQRLNLIETLRAAAPWQPVRRAARADPADGARIEVRRDDMRVTRLKRRSQSATIFVVDASGSAAFRRLAEAKGAVELLLADCYVRRDQVAVVAFRGEGAELLLPPTRSLVRAKRSLAELPGGGGTPLASALDAAGALADSLKRKGSSPTVVLLTDGRANIARDGARGRPKAEADAMAAAREMRIAGVSALLVDTSPFPEPAAQRLAAEMAATYVPLPFADSAALSEVVRAAATGPSRTPAGVVGRAA